MSCCDCVPRSFVDRVEVVELFNIKLRNCDKFTPGAYLLMVQNLDAWKGLQTARKLIQVIRRVIHTDHIWVMCPSGYAASGVTTTL